MGTGFVASLLAISRLVRARDRFVAALGPACTSACSHSSNGGSTWVLGKLEVRVYRLVAGH